MGVLPEIRELLQCIEGKRTKYKRLLLVWGVASKAGVQSMPVTSWKLVTVRMSSQRQSHSVRGDVFVTRRRLSGVCVKAKSSDNDFPGKRGGRVTTLESSGSGRAR